MTDFLFQRKQRFLLTDIYSSWASVEAGAPLWSMLWTLFLLIYVNDLFDGLASSLKLFADDTALVSIVHDVNLAANNLNNGLTKTSQWALQWKMNFNSDPSKQTQEVFL